MGERSTAMEALLSAGGLPRAAADAGVTAAVVRSGSLGSGPGGAGGEVVSSDGPWINRGKRESLSDREWLSEVVGAGAVGVAGSWILGPGLGAPGGPRPGTVGSVPGTGGCDPSCWCWGKCKIQWDDVKFNVMMLLSLL